MKISINRSLINDLYENAAQNVTMLKAALGTHDEIPKREDLVTGAVKKCGVATIMVTEVEVIIEIPDDFFIDTMRLQSNAIPLFAPVIGSTIGAMKIFKGMTQTYKDKWFPKTEAELKREEARKREMNIRRATETEMAAFEAGRQHASREFVLHGGLADLKVPSATSEDRVAKTYDTPEEAAADGENNVIQCTSTILWAEMDENETISRELIVPVGFDVYNLDGKVMFVRKNGQKIMAGIGVVAKEFIEFVQGGCMIMPVQRGSNDVVFCKTSDHKYNIRHAVNGRIITDMRFEPIEMELALEALLPFPDAETMQRLNEEQSQVDAKRIEGAGMKLQ